MPDVRCACAAQSSARAALRLHRTFVQPAVPPRGRSASRRAAHIAIRSHRRASGNGPSQSSRLSPTARLITGTADGTSFTLHGSSRAFALPVLWLFGYRRSGTAFGKRPGIDGSLAMPSFAVSTASGSIPAHQPTGETALGLSLVLRRPRSSSTRPELTRARLTPACSGLAALAADARR
jgi:hypothetical protein